MIFGRTSISASRRNFYSALARRNFSASSLNDRSLPSVRHSERNEGSLFIFLRRKASQQRRELLLAAANLVKIGRAFHQFRLLAIMHCVPCVLTRVVPVAP